ncbi:hypothetical protein LRY65_04170 [Candidatus Woesebacteria bacterium]|nr:hypothetical protein [Candidatus Woesebacteria bacterium]MCD8527374.1 hypothetical protein [Candidatus Woesebacteria bacterium]MCD8546121.1 hypothetical protein [Candidatus Woesebacteria bacterium]
MAGNTAARLTQESRYLVSLMRETIPDHKLEMAIDILDQCALALRFYAATKQGKYLNELVWAVRRLSLLLEKKGDGNE